MMKKAIIFVIWVVLRLMSEAKEVAASVFFKKKSNLS